MPRAQRAKVAKDVKDVLEARTRAECEAANWRVRAGHLRFEGVGRARTRGNAKSRGGRTRHINGPRRRAGKACGSAEPWRPVAETHSSLEESRLEAESRRNELERQAGSRARPGPARFLAQRATPLMEILSPGSIVFTGQRDLACRVLMRLRRAARPL